jgi:hypothetical protein
MIDLDGVGVAARVLHGLGKQPPLSLQAGLSCQIVLKSIRQVHEVYLIVLDGVEVAAPVLHGLGE